MHHQRARGIDAARFVLPRLCLLLEDWCAEAIAADAKRTNYEESVDLVQSLFGAGAITDRFLAPWTSRRVSPTAG